MLTNRPKTTTSLLLLLDMSRFRKREPLRTEISKNEQSVVLPAHIKTGCVLQIPKQIYSKLDACTVEGGQRRKYVNSKEFISSIRKNALVHFDPKNKICQLSPACFGMLRDVVRCISNDYTPKVDFTLWISCDLKDQKLKEKIKEVVQAGFSSPYICEKSPLSRTAAATSPSICMYRKCDGDLCPIIDMENVIYVLKEYHKNQPHCSLNLSFHPDSVAFLQKLSFTGKSKNKDGSITQKEIAGSLYIDQADHKIKVNHETVKLGEERGVEIENGTFNFHSHPKEAYEHFETKLGWPSCHDYKGFLDSYLDTGTIFHVVACIEGVYILSIKKEFVNSKSTLLKFKNGKYIIRHYRIPFNTLSSPQEYVDVIHKIPNNIFQVSYHTWPDLKRSTASFITTVSFNRTGKNCFTDLDVLEIIKLLHKKK